MYTMRYRILRGGKMNVEAQQQVLGSHPLSRSPHKEGGRSGRVLGEIPIRSAAGKA